MTFDAGGALVAVAGEAKRGRGGGDQLDVRRLLVDPHLMATQTAHFHGRVNGFSLGFVRMTLEAFGCIHVRLEGNRMLHGDQRANKSQREQACPRNPQH